jgi:hypothetical protein
LLPMNQSAPVIPFTPEVQIQFPDRTARRTGREPLRHEYPGSVSGPHRAFSKSQLSAAASSLSLNLGLKQANA